MLQMLGAYKVGSFEMRLLGMNCVLSDLQKISLDEVCLKQMTDDYPDWQQCDHGFMMCSSLENNSLTVSEVLVHYVILSI